MTALITAADVAGSKTQPSTSPSSSDPNRCVPGDPLASEDETTGSVNGPSLGLNEPGNVLRFYSSNATQAPPAQVAAYIRGIGSSAGAECVREDFKKALSNRMGASGLTGDVASVPVADGGYLISLNGDVIVNGTPFLASFELITFQKGQVLVLLTVSASSARTIPGQGLELAQRIADRLP